MRIITLDPEKFDNYALTHRYRNYYQTSAYGKTMINFGYNVSYIGIVDEDTEKLIGASLLIYKEVFMNNKVAYAPRGILFDYEDPIQVKELALKLRQTLGRQGFMLLRIDPLVPATIRDMNGNIINMNRDFNIVMANLKNAGFQHKGNNLFFETEKSRWEALVLLNKERKKLYSKLTKRTRHKVAKAINSGIEIYKDPNNDVTKLYEFIKNKHQKPIEYYQELVKNYKNNIEVFYAKLNTEKFVIASKRAYENEMMKNDTLARKIQNPDIKGIEQRKILNQKMESDKLLGVYKKDLVFATNELKNHPEGIIIGGSINIVFDNAAHMIIEGFDPKYRTLNSNYLLKWGMIEIYNDKKYKYFNMNAVTGEFIKENKYKGLNEMKLGYNAVISEYIGEFDLILNNLSYNLYKGLKK